MLIIRRDYRHNRQSAIELARLIVEFSLLKLTYRGDIKEYKCQTTEALNWLGIGINIIKPDTC